MREVDGVIPDCETEAGCLIPMLSGQWHRLLEIRAVLADLKESVGAETVCRLYEVDRDDLAGLALIERELRNNDRRGKENQDG